MCEVPKIGDGLTEEVRKNSKGEYWAVNGARKYIASEVEEIGPFCFVKVDEEDTESPARKEQEKVSKY